MHCFTSVWTNAPAYVAFRNQRRAQKSEYSEENELLANEWTRDCRKHVENRLFINRKTKLKDVKTEYQRKKIQHQAIGHRETVTWNVISKIVWKIKINLEREKQNESTKLGKRRLKKCCQSARKKIALPFCSIVSLLSWPIRMDRFMHYLPPLFLMPRTITVKTS